MRDLSKFPLVKQALEQVVAESDVNNGTNGIELIAHFWEQEYIYDKTRSELQTKIAKALLSGSIEGVKQMQIDLDKLPKPKIVMAWKLMQPIKRLQGTKILHDGEKTYKISMENVGMVYIPEDPINLGLLEYEETKDIMTDAQGRESTVLKIHLKKGIIDVAAPVYKNERQIRPSRAYVTAISYKAMQTAGELMNIERRNMRKRYGFEETNI